MAFVTNGLFGTPCAAQRTSLMRNNNVCERRIISPRRGAPTRGDVANRRRVHHVHTHTHTQTPKALQVKEVSAEELEIALQTNARPMLVDAFAKWCGPCQFLLPQLDIVAKKFEDRLDILKFDTEQYPKLATALRVQGLPTLFFVKDGKLRYRMEGALMAEQLEEIVEFVLFDGPPPSFAAPQEPKR